MNSRRGFLKGGTISLSAFFARTSQGQDGPQMVPESQPRPARDYWNDFPAYLSGLVNAARAARKSELARVTDSESARRRNSFVTGLLWDLIGGKPDSTPLNPAVTGTIERSAYRIERVIFESQPQFYVTAHLYLPKSAAPPFPAILAPLGHAPTGKLYPPYQTIFQNLARRGFAVLAYDPPGQGERLQYLSSANQSLYEPTGEHDQFGWPALLAGSTATQFEVWDGIRALDYLLSRHEIDPTRIGCCGHSGGGTQTMFLCALEPRLRAAVVVEGHTENLSGADYEPPGAFADAEQNIIGGLKAGIDRGDLLCAFAPKPLLICYTSQDDANTYSPHYVRGTQEIYDEAKQFYRACGAPENVGLFHSTLPHEYDYFHRGATYNWFAKWLQDGAVPTAEVPLDEAPDASLWCTASGQVLTSLGGRPAWEVNLDRLRSGRSHDAAPAQPGGIQIAVELARVLSVPASHSIKRSATISSQTLQDVVVEDFEFVSEPPIRVPGWLVKPATGNGRFPAIVLLQDQGRDGVFDCFETTRQLVRQGIAVCSIDLRTRGMTTPRPPSTGPVFYGGAVERAYAIVSLWAGVPIVGQQTADLIGCMEYLTRRPDVAPSRIAVAASGRSALPALFAAALDSHVRALFLDRGLLDMESVVAARKYDLPVSHFAFGLLRKLDLPEICAAMARRPVLFANPVDPAGEVVPLARAAARYRPMQSTANVSFVVRPDAIINLLSDWARKSLG